MYSARQLNDIEKFCCYGTEPVPLAVDTTFNLCDLWLTDSSYKNKRLVNTLTGTSPVFFGPCMLHFTKDVEAFSRFALELRAGNAALKDLKTIGVDMEAAIFNGFKIHQPDVSRLICVRHLKKRDEEKTSKLLERTNQTAAQKAHSKAELIKDIYGNKEGGYYEYGLAEAFDAQDFEFKLQSLRQRWDALIPGFFDWFVAKRQSLFTESIIESARNGTGVQGLYYQNDVECMHSVQKCIQNFKKEDALTVVKNLQRLCERQDAEEVRAIYGAGNYVLDKPYQSFKVASSEWHSWSESRRRAHVDKLRKYTPTVGDSFSKPKNSGRKPSFRRREKSIVPDILVDRHATIPPTQSPSTDLCSGEASTLSTSLRFNDPRYIVYFFY